MSPRMYDFLAQVGALGFLIAIAFLLVDPSIFATRVSATNPIQNEKIAPVDLSLRSATKEEKPQNEPIIEEAEPQLQASAPGEEEKETSGISRIENPYSFAPHNPETLNNEARAALVNILCESGSNSVKSISGSGVIIDPRGIVLTNAHVAQFVLLAGHSNFKISCKIRAGSPARSLWHSDILFFPRKWMLKHASSIVESSPVGTGEHDYALLLITSRDNDSSLPTSFPYLPLDTRERIGFVGDPILIAGYPAEFGGSTAARDALYASTVFTTIKQMMTFSENLVDMISLGGTVLAQSGSSGGSAVNYWGQVIGIVSTTSDGDTTDARDLRAITPAHVDRSLQAHTGLTLEQFLSQNVAATTSNFEPEAQALTELLIEEIRKVSSN